MPWIEFKATHWTETGYARLLSHYRTKRNLTIRTSAHWGDLEICDGKNTVTVSGRHEIKALAKALAEAVEWNYGCED